MATDEKKLSLKLLIDNESKKVLYAEAGKDVVDFLFGLLALPLGKVSSLLSGKEMVGSIAALRNSLEKLDMSYVVSSQMKTALLGPSTALFYSQISNIGLLLGPSSLPKFYKCNRCNSSTNEYGIRCTRCNSGTMTI
jgi:Protein of unknown function (DUF674)